LNYDLSKYGIVVDIVRDVLVELRNVKSNYKPATGSVILQSYGRMIANGNVAGAAAFLEKYLPKRLLAPHD